MNLLNVYIVFTLLCWSAWGIVDKKALAHASQESIMLRQYLLAVLWLPVCFLGLNFYFPSWHFTGEVVMWSGLAALAYVVALVAYLKAMSVSEASYVLGITAAYPLIFQILATVFLKESLVPMRMIGGAIIAFGLILISGSAKKSEGGEPAPEGGTVKHQPPSPQTILCLVTATLCWGVYALFDKKALSYGPPLLVLFAKMSWDFLVFFVLLAVYTFLKRKIDWKNKKAWFYCVYSECSLGIGGFTYLGALSMATASYVITITGCYPLLMYLFALWLLKEKFNKSRFAGIIFVVVGGTLVQLTAAA